MISNKERCLRFAGDSTLHGVSRITDTKASLFRRVFWLVLFLAMVGTFVYFITEQSVKYLSYPKSTRIEIKEQKPIKFPSVTICNQNLFRKSIILQSPPIMQTILKLRFPAFGKPDVGNISFTPEYDQINMTDMNLQNVQPLEEMFIYCKFRGSALNCTESFTLIPTAFGYCYIFNSYEHVKKHGSFETYSTGSAHGLYLRMNVNQSEYFFGPSSSAGFKVVLHDHEVFPDIESHAVVIKPGFETFLSVKLIKTENLPPPYEDANCEDHTIKKLKFYNSYGKTECMNECFADFMLQSCGCIHRMIVPVANLTCNISTGVKCASPADQRYHQERLYEKCNCPDKCSNVRYQVSASQAVFPSQPRLDEIKNGLGHSEKFVRDNFLELRVYFEELNYNYIKEFASYTIGNFWADLGGQLGLCMGASVITVLEFVDFISCLLRRNTTKTLPKQ